MTILLELDISLRNMIGSFTWNMRALMRFCTTKNVTVGL